LIRFFLYGLLGWCLEIVWTAIYSTLWPEEGERNFTLTGKTYLWMLPIYGGAALLFEPVHNTIRGLWWFDRGLVWMILCFLSEYLSGLALKRLLGRCPWDYSYSKFHIHGLIRLDYAPLWFLVGLFYERIHDLLLRLPG
jgi:uncharacterized membrane protein